MVALTVTRTSVFLSMDAMVITCAAGARENAEGIVRKESSKILTSDLSIAIALVDIKIR
jgi:hypothetical protein